MLIKRLLTALVLGAMLMASAACNPLAPSTMKVTALMTDSAGLFVGNDVGVLGVTIGKVTSIKPEGDHVRVVMRVNTDQPIPKTAGAVTVARSVATDRYVELTPVYKSGPKMTDGAVIAEPQTRTPVDFDTILAAMNTLATGIAGSGQTTNAIGRFLSAGSKAVDGKGALFNQTITSLGEAVNGVSGQRGNITSTLTSLDTLTQALAANQQTVRTFVTQISRASQMFAAERNNFRSALRNLASAVDLIAQFAHDNRQQVVLSLNRASKVLNSLLSRRADLTEFVRVMPLTLQNLARTYMPDGWLRVVANPSLLAPLFGSTITDLCAPGGLLELACPGLGPTGLSTLTNLLSSIPLLGGTP